MKGLITIVFLLLTTQFASANAEVLPVVNLEVKEIVVKKNAPDSDALVRLYRHKNSRIKSALEFRTKRNSKKLA